MICRICLLVLLSIFIQNGFSQSVEYDSVMNSIQKLETQLDYLSAKNLIEQHIINFPEKWFTLSKELIYVNSKLEKYEDNLSIFKEAHQKGYFYFLHPQMPTNKPYLNLPEFDVISKQDLELMQIANQHSKTIYEVQVPVNYVKNEKFPLIFLFHGGGKNINDVQKHWQVDVLNDNFIKVYVQSYRHFDSKTYGWPNLDERLDNDIQTIYNEIVGNYSIDTNSIVLGSISAGATSAIDLALRSVIPVSAVIAYCPNMPTLIINKKFELISNQNCKFFIVTGSEDRLIARQNMMVEIFESLEIACNYTIVENMGHEYPKDESYFTAKGINYINDTKE